MDKNTLLTIGQVAAMIGENTRKTRYLIDAGRFGQPQKRRHGGLAGGMARLLTPEQVYNFQANWVKIGRFWVPKQQQNQ
jgi:hypothetical protein